VTKMRAPGTIEEALALIARRVPGNWKAMAKRIGRTARTVRSYGDKDRQGDISIVQSIALDNLFQEHGGEGRPLFEAHGRLVSAASAIAISCKVELLRRIGGLTRDVCEAEEALINFALPDAGEADRRHAHAELLDLDRTVGILVDALAAEPEQHQRGPPVTH